MWYYSQLIENKWPSSTELVVDFSSEPGVAKEMFG